MDVNEALNKIEKVFMMCDWTDEYGEFVDTDEYYKALEVIRKNVIEVDYDL